MDKRSILALTAFFALFAICGEAAAEREGDDRVKQDFIDAMPADAVSGVEVFESHGFRVESAQADELGADLKPSGDQFQVLSATADGLFKVLVEKGRPMSAGGGVSVVHDKSGAPMLSTADRNGDGRIDMLTYSVLDQDGQTVVLVTDYDVDGQADLRVHLQESYAEIWHEDRWYRIERRDGVRGIVVDGDFREVRNVDNRPVVQ